MDIITCLIIDDSTLYRKFIKDILSEIPGIKILGTAPDGKIGLDKCRLLQPDFVTLDLEMPRVDGMAFLHEIKKMEHQPLVMVISATADLTLRALQAGAFEFIAKSESDNMDTAFAYLRVQLGMVINAVRARLHKPVERRVVTPVVKRPPVRPLKKKPEVIAIGVSTGGPEALKHVIPRIPSRFPLPILIVQHMPPRFTEALARSLDRDSELQVIEAMTQTKLEPGMVYIAPGGKQMRVIRSSLGLPVLQITDDAPVNNCKPSVDYLLKSMTKVYAGAVMAIIMTGMGNDGTQGCKLLSRQGARIIAQSEATCTVFGMPREVINAQCVDKVVDLDDIANEIVYNFL